MRDLFSDRRHAFRADLYECTRASATATSEEWVTAFARAAHDANSEVQAAWDFWNNSERRLMAVISERTTPLQGRIARERYGVSKTGSNQGTIERLQRDGHVIADETTRTGWRVVDPLLELWLANGRSWRTHPLPALVCDQRAQRRALRRYRSWLQTRA
jgi:hypothetical protein